MISSAAEYEKAHSDLRILEQRIADLEREHPIGEKRYTKAGVRKMIAKINEELAAFEGRPTPWPAVYERPGQPWAGVRPAALR